jgi:hypothetical protein
LPTRSSTPTPIFLAFSGVVVKTELFAKPMSLQ